MDALQNKQPKTRTSAKEAVSSRWASRAEQSVRANAVKQQRQKQQSPQTTTHTETTNHTTPINRICHTWKQVQYAIGGNLLGHLAREQKLYKPKPKSIAPRKKAPKKTPNPRKKITAPQRKANKDQLANTLTNIRVSTALQNQLVEITNGESKKYLKSVLSILPAGFDESSALTSSIQNRKRAFLLMDLGRVIRAHAQFIAYTCGFGDVKAGELQLPPTHKLRRMRGDVNNVGRKRKGVYIQPQFKVMKNPSSELLKLLTRLGVDLRCNSSDDVLTACQAIKEERSERDGESDEGVTNDKSQFGEEAMVLVDDVSKSRKPNGYFRRLLQAQGNRQNMNHVDMAVDGVDEVHRLSNTAQQLTKRNRSNIEMDGFRIILRLPAEKAKDGTWEKLVLAVHAAAVEVNCDLVGVSVNLSPWSDSLSSSNTDAESERILNEICTHLRIFRLLMLSVGQYHIRIDLTGLPYPLSRENSETLTDALKCMICCDVSGEELTQLRVDVPDDDEVKANNQMQTIAEMANDSSMCSVIFTADVSDHLVARAGALCTRIIGVKNGKEPSQDEVDPASGAISKHYYIDDGCYGSLGSSKCSSENTCSPNLQECDEQNAPPVKEHLPLPLYGGRLSRKASHLSLTSRKKIDPISNSIVGKCRNVKSTVWGPTCDGLDKVCDNVMLPDDLQANRDWFVFSNLGCGGFGGGLGLGTAFNGFDPPDVSYCVLGYFAHLVEK